MLVYMKTGKTPVTEFLRGRMNGAFRVLNDQVSTLELNGDGSCERDPWAI